jgi:hypothetical protein
MGGLGPGAYLQPDWSRCPRTIVLPLVILAVGCVEEREPNPEPELPRWQLIEDVRLDPDVEDFSVVGRVRVGAHGWIAVALPQDAQVRLYDPDGDLAAAIGRRGEGPGEFAHVGPMTWVADTLVIDDGRLRRLTYVDLNGTVVRTRTLPSPFAESTATSGASQESVPFQYFLSLSAGPGDEVHGVAYPLAQPRGPERVPPPNTLISLDTDGTARSLATPPDPYDDRWMITIAGLSNPVPLALRPLTVFSSDGRRFAFATADQSRRDGTFTVAVLEVAGDTVFQRSYPFQGEPIAQAEADSAIASMAPRPAVPPEGPGPRLFQDVARERIPAVHSPLHGVVPALDGNVWVTLRGTPEAREALVLDSDGSPTALVPLPPGSRIEEASPTHLYLTEADSLGLSSVVRYRIVRPE